MEPLILLMALHDSVLETIATTTSIALLGPNNCLGTTCVREQEEANQEAKAGDPEDTVMDPPLRNVEFTAVQLGRRLGVVPVFTHFLRCVWTKARNILCFLVHDNSPLIFSLTIFSLADCNDFFLLYSFTGLFRVKFMPCFSSI